MPVSGSAAVTLIDLLRKPPDAASAKSTDASGRFQELFQRVSTDTTRPATSPDATQPAAGPASTSATTAAEGVRDAAPVKVSARVAGETSGENAGIRDATVVGREARPRDVQVAAATGQTTTSAEPATSDTPQAVKTESTATSSAGETAAQPKGDAPQEAATDAQANATASNGDEGQTSQQVVADVSQEAATVVPEVSPQVALADPTLITVTADTQATPVDVAAAEALLAEVALAEASTQVQNPAVVTAYVGADVVEVVGEEVTVPTSAPVASTPTPSVAADAARVVGQEFPVGTTTPEKISTDQLIQALEARIMAEEASPSEVAAWRQAFSTDVEEASLLSQVWSRSQGSAQAGFEPLAGTPGASMTTQAATAGAPMMAAAGSAGPAQVGTHPASGVMRSMSAQTDGAAASGRQGFALGSSPTQSSETGSSLQAAQAALSRRAADRAFQSPRAVVNQPPPAIDMLSEGATRFPDTEQAVRDAIVARQNRMHSFVRAQRGRGTAPPPTVGGAGNASGAEQATPVVGAVMTSASGTAATSSSGVTTHQSYTPLMEFLANEVRRNVRLGKREFRVQLNPEALGSVELEMVMDDDVLTVRLKAASKPSQRILEENLGDLAKALEAVGMGLDTDVPWQASSEMVDAAIADAGSRQAVPAWI